MKPTPTARRLLQRNLLLFVLLLVWAGFALVYFGKLATTPPLPANAVDINTAPAQEIQQALAISKRQAEQIVALRDERGGFASVYSLRNARLLKGVAIRWEPGRFYVRAPADVARTFWGVAIAFSLLLILGHLLLWRGGASVDPLLFPLIALLAGLGLILVYTVKDPFRDTFAFATQAKGVLLFGSIALAVPFTRAYRSLALHRYGYGYAAGAIVLMLLLMAFGHGPAGVRIEVLGFEPVEFIKVLLVFFVAAYLAERRVSLGPGARLPGLANAREIVPMAAVYIFVLLLFAAIKDLGPAVLLFGTFIALIYLVTGKSAYPIAGALLLIAAGAVGYKLGFGFFATRVQMWLSPWDNHNRLGGQLAQGLWGMATGGVWGSGLGLGHPALVPRAGSDMVFTTLGEELGLFGTLGVILLFVVIIYRGMRIALSAADEFDRLLAAGLTTLIGLQALIITAGATGLLPLTGITLPFVSYGTSSLTADFFTIGVLLSISGKSLPGKLTPAPPPIFLSASRRLVLGLIFLLLVGVGIGRLLWVEGVDDNATASRQLVIPDADGVVRQHINPRLLAFAAAIPRGRIVDCNGNVLAESADQGVPYFAGVPRRYPYGAVGANVVYAVEQPASSRNPLGQDATLRGYDSAEDLLPYYRRKDLPFASLPSGQDVKLTLDIGLQRVAEQALARAADRLGDGRGAVVALDARTGALLAAATAPSFDPNTLTPDQWEAIHASSAPGNPLLNRSFAGLYPPGSAFKLVTATAAFEQGKSGLIFSCHHTLDNIRWVFNGQHYARRRVTDEAGMPPHGTENMANALRVSCNVYFAQLGIALGATALSQAISDYELTDCPPLAKIGEDLPDCAYGQGTILVTPYQMARVAQAIANSGKLCSPLFVAGGGSPSMPQPVLPAADARQIGLMMQGVVTRGTAEGVFNGLPFSVAGKTGSAQLARGRTHSWFVGFAPADRPRVAFACIVEHGGQGRQAAAPVCRALLEKALR